jgi:hypothetical protein
MAHTHDSVPNDVVCVRIACVIASEKSLGGQSQVLTDVVRIGLPDLLSGIRE